MLVYVSCYTAPWGRVTRLVYVVSGGRVEVEWMQSGGSITLTCTAMSRCHHACMLLYCTEVHCTVLYCAVLCCTVLYCTVLCCTVLHCTVLYCTVLHCTALYCTVLYCTVLYCTVLYCIILQYLLTSINLP